MSPPPPNPFFLGDSGDRSAVILKLSWFNHCVLLINVSFPCYLITLTTPDCFSVSVIVTCWFSVTLKRHVVLDIKETNRIVVGFACFPADIVVVISRGKPSTIIWFTHKNKRQVVASLSVKCSPTQYLALISLMHGWLLQSNQVKRTPQDYINELIIWILNLLVVSTMQ